MTDRRQLRSGFGCRLLDDEAAEVSLEFVVVDDDGVVCDMFDELFVPLVVVLEVDEFGMVVLDVDEFGMVELEVDEFDVVVDGVVAVEVVLELAGRVAVLFVDCA